MLLTINTSAKFPMTAEEFRLNTKKSYENNPGRVRRHRFKKNQGVKPRYSHALACCFIAGLMTPLASGFKDCGPGQIKYINKKTGQIDHCMNCPSCIPSQQYSIPCGSTVDTGKLGTCMDCPDETYTDSFGTKPCQPCTTCTNRKYIQKCTKSQNAICGDCLDGFKEDHNIFACKKDPSSKNKQITKTTEKITQATTTVTPTAFTTARLKNSTSNIKKDTKPAIRNRTLPKTSNTNTSHTSAFPRLIVPNSQEVSPPSSEKSESLKDLILVVVIAFLLVCCIMISGVAFFLQSRSRKRNNRLSKEEGDQEEKYPLQEMTNTRKGPSTQLNDYMMNGTARSRDNYSTICLTMSGKDKLCYESVLAGLGVEPKYFKSLTKFEDALEKLQSLKPKMTLEQIAQVSEKNKVCDVARLIREEDDFMKKEKATTNAELETVVSEF